MTVYQMVYSLAKAHLHGWTRYSGFEDLVNQVAAISSPEEWEEFERTVNEAMTARENKPGAIWTDLGLRPSLTHLTQTGRLSWSADPESGQLRICAYRPGALEPRLVVDALVLDTPGGPMTNYIKVDGTQDGAQLRHLAAVEHALAAIHGGSECSVVDLVILRLETGDYGVYLTCGPSRAAAVGVRVRVKAEVAALAAESRPTGNYAPFLMAGKEEE